MRQSGQSRRTFVRRGLVSGAAAGWALSRLSAASYARVIGANDRINLGLIGCGGRGRYIMEHMVKKSGVNAGLTAVCDVWKHRLETYPAEAEKLFGAKPKAYADYRKLLEDADVDAVVIGTPDHQHMGQTIDSVQAGKHVYVEKPIAAVMNEMADLNRCYDVVKNSKRVVQNGTQGVSGPAAPALKQFIADRKLGKLFRIESSESLVVPYWVNYKGPQTEAETDWKAWLYNRKDRPFDAHLHACWMGYHEITSGAIGGWMSHFINMVHYVTGCELPVQAMAWGGKYASSNDARCDAPDQVTVMLDYAEGFCTQFTSHFGNTRDSEGTVFFFEKGIVRCGFGHYIVNPAYSSEGVDDSMKPKKLLDVDPQYPGPDHVKNWCECIRGGGRPNADMEFGYKHGVAVIMGDAAYCLGRKVAFDKASREIKPVA